MELSHVLQASKELKEKTNAEIVITGTWSWAKFKSKPDDTILEWLKKTGWKYQVKTQKWYLVGKSSPRFSKKSMGWNYIQNKYGVEDLENINN